MDNIRVRGIIQEIRRGGQFLVALQDAPEHLINAYLSGKMKIRKITLTNGDHVDLEVSPYDLHRGRIVWRHNIQQ